MNKLITDDFLEFGSSGMFYNKLNYLEPDQSPRGFTVSDFKISELSKDVSLARYKITEDGTASLRSSIWKRYGDECQMVAHQDRKYEVSDDYNR
jgi:hypothetical protein